MRTHAHATCRPRAHQCAGRVQGVCGACAGRGAGRVRGVFRARACSTMVGAIEDSGRLPGAMKLAADGAIP